MSNIISELKHGHPVLLEVYLRVKTCTSGTLSNIISELKNGYLMLIVIYLRVKTWALL